MANDGNPSGAASGGDLALVGEGSNRSEISIQVLQDIYHELTGKSEDVSKYFDEPYQVKHGDFEQLHHRLSQVCEQFNICSSNCSITVFYLNDTTDTFSSFDRFRSFNAGSTSAVESVLFTYNFLVVLPKLKEPQGYTVSIRVASPITIEAKMRATMFYEVPKILRILAGRTAVATVKYVDYVVARNILNTIDEWFEGLDKDHVPKWWRFLRRHTEYLPWITRYFVGASAVAMIVAALPGFLNAASTPLDLARVMLVAYAGVFAAYKLAQHLGMAAEDTVDRWSPLAYISLTAGDRTQIETAKRRNRNSLVFGGAKFIAGLLVASVVQFAVDYLLNLAAN